MQARILDISIDTIDTLEGCDHTTFCEVLSFSQKIEVINAFITKFYDYPEFVKEMEDIADKDFEYEICMYGSITEIFWEKLPKDKESQNSRQSENPEESRSNNPMVDLRQNFCKVLIFWSFRW